MYEAYKKYFPRKVKKINTKRLKQEIEFAEFELPILKKELMGRYS